MNELFLFTKHPYVAGIVTIIWVASTILFAIDRDLPIVSIVMTNMIISFLISTLGMRVIK